MIKNGEDVEAAIMHGGSWFYEYDRVFHKDVFSKFKDLFSDYSDALSQIAEINVIIGGDGNEELNGTINKDVFYGGAGDDTLNGGAGNDAYYIEAGHGNDLIIDKEGDNKIVFTDGLSMDDYDMLVDARKGFVLTHKETEETIGLRDFITNPLNYDFISGDKSITDNIGGGKREIFNGTAEDDVIEGGDGFNIFYGGAGDDVLNGGKDMDFMYGGDGDDILNGRNGLNVMFGEGGDGGAAAGAEAGPTGAEAPDAAEQPQRKRGKKNLLANVRYGVQQEQQPVEETGSTDGEKQEAKRSFDDLIKGEYKADFDAHVQNIIQQRFKKNQETENRLTSLNPIMELLGKKYNVDPQDIEQLTKVMSDDDSLYEDEAIERGMSIESLKAIKRMERENEQLRQQNQMSMQQQMIREHLNSLGQQAEELKKIYPTFNLQAELQNPMFARLTSPNSGIDVRTAFEVVHRDELRGAEMEYAAQRSAERVAASVRANRSRPAEGAMNGSQANSVVKSDPRTLTKEDRAEIRRRVRNGEKIVF